MNARRLRDVCRAIIDLDLGIPWTTFSRADAIDRENAGLLRESGCQSVQLGLESGDNAILANMNKKETTGQYFEALSALNEAGVNVRASFIAGYPAAYPERHQGHSPEIEPSGACPSSWPTSCRPSAVAPA